MSFVLCRNVRIENKLASRREAARKREASPGMPRLAGDSVIVGIDDSLKAAGRHNVFVKHRIFWLHFSNNGPAAVV